MSLRCGCDIVEIARVARLMEQRTWLTRVFHPAELSNQTAGHLAGVFAAKEAAMKALSMPPGSWLSLEIVQEQSGRPLLRVSSEYFPEGKSIDCSIAHDGGLAIAFVIII